MMNRKKVHSHLCSAPSFFKLSVGLWLMMAWMSLGLGTADAQTGLKIQLVPETTAIVPGKPFRVGLHIQHEKGWHTYWRQPGIVGVPTSLAWELPEGFTAGELEFPEPESVLMFHIKAQGYERDVLMQTVITPPADLQTGQTLTLAGQATWMCCGNTCHPGHMRLTLQMPVAAESRPDSQWQPVFEKERATYPRASDAWTAEATEDGLKVTLILTPAPSSQARLLKPDEKLIFFTEDGWINSDEPQLLEPGSDGRFTLRLTRADVFLGKTIPQKLHGILQREGGWEESSTWRSLRVEPVLKR